MTISRTLLGGLLGFAVAQAAAAPAALTETVEQRITGDRSGVCLVASRVDTGIEHVSACADDLASRALDEQSRFEIGSISKALQGLLVAVLVEANAIDLEQTLAETLPSAESVPGPADEPIRLRHLLTHTSGLPRLPPGFAPQDLTNPYAALQPQDLISALAHSELQTRPGERFAYSNFGAMLLSLALVEHTGQPLTELFEQHVFQPLEMTQTSLDGPTVTGHDGNGMPTVNWDFHPDLGSVGAIRSTAADLSRWLSAMLAPEDSELSAALTRSAEPLIEAQGQIIGYGWLHLPLNDRVVLAHDGGTGGFSSFAVVDPNRKRAVTVLMDTSMIASGSLSDLAYHLVDSAYPLGQPERPTAAAAGETLEDYQGKFALYDGEQPFMGDFTLEFSVHRGELLIQAGSGGQVQPQIPLRSEGQGRFVQEDLDLVIEFQRDDSGQVPRLDFRQGALSLDGRRQ
ncbi:MAG TPA: serine hydrolase [Wenzhouxiangella sp.]|nr:serine hydrolase [Wenzhouxiangella sp.]